jgi:hypothetical protein
VRRVIRSATGKATQVGAVKGMNGKLIDIAVWK